MHSTTTQNGNGNGNGSKIAGPSKEASSSSSTQHHHDHDELDHDHDHEHGHSLFHSHSHSRDDGHSQQVESVVKIFEGKLDRGSRITLVGLGTNVVLTGAKGAAGWFMNSAALLAEAGHSASDLLGDLVTLFSWRFSKKAPTARYPYGFGKFETLGTTTVALLLIGGAFGIGIHSLHLLIHHLTEAAATLPASAPAAMHSAIQNVTHVAQSVVSAVPGGLGHSHSHGGGVLDPNAAWFALASVIMKEWVYRATKRVADAERSPVLLANAIHHRSDAYTSAVALAAILGTWYFPALPLDPIGGMLVSLIILKQGVSLFAGAFGELTDAGVSPRTQRVLSRTLLPLVASSNSSVTISSPSSLSPASFSSSSPHLNPLLSISNLRAQRSGANIFVDVDARVPASLSIIDAIATETRIRDALLDVRKEIKEVRVKFIPVSSFEDEDDEHEHNDDDAMQGREDKSEELRSHSHPHPHSHQ
ncbi:hypothetical protein SCHPADRAFT_835637 [Schizopora paradoxa]|uniref:Cation efflux protein transmembrane domain-containing protein n=1 Tax=Schizopora paradoxa TaxID=27342 RepID=A0A0H2RTQ9_9AGAM|nr:hypothetical protein SCHPADRAFT_835637 [Schizopora paradoxa]